jgi:DNA-directed RNA polymerase specialized sigma24 family protein
MPSSGDITHWLRLLQAGEREAVQKLWEGYFRRLVMLARKKLGELPRRAADEDDVALSAFDSFCRGAEAGRFPQLEDRDDLWRVLVTITARKATDLIAHEGRDKRDWRRLQEQLAGDSDSGGPLLRMLFSQEPDPAFAVEVADEVEHLLSRLPNDELRQIALGKLEGYTNEEIAQRIELAPATVERRLRLIRKHWASEVAP